MKYAAPTYARVSIVLALPRSATFWSTQLVRPGVQAALHDPLGPVRGDVGALRDQLDAELEQGDGRIYVADTGGMLCHRALRKALPGARWGFIFREPHQVAHALRALGLTEILPLLPTMARALEEAWALAPAPVRVRYTRPFSRAGAEALWRLATGHQAGQQWLERMRWEQRERPLAEQLAALQ